MLAPAMVPAPHDASSFIANDFDGPALDTADTAASSSFSSSYAAQRAIRRAGAADARAWRGENPSSALVEPNLSGACGPELGRWVTPYRRRVGRWLTEVSQPPFQVSKNLNEKLNSACFCRHVYMRGSTSCKHLSHEHPLAA